MVRAKKLILLLLVGLWAAVSNAPAQTIPMGVLPQPSPDKSTLELSVENSTYAPGDRIQIDIEAKEEGYLYLYDIDPWGSVTLLFPNAYQPDPRVPAGTTKLPGEGYHFTVGYPEGIETLVAILSQEPIEQLSAPSDSAYRPLGTEPQSLVDSLSIELDETGWSTSWVQFNVYQPKGFVYIQSYPAGATIRIDGEDRGLAPKELILPAGKANITLLKSGYEVFTQTVTIDDQDTIDIQARLQRAMPSPGNYSRSVPAFFVIDAGTDSIGMEIGALATFGLAIAIRFSEQGLPLPGETFNMGPELDLDLRARIKLGEILRLLVGVGGGFQNTSVAAAATGNIDAKAIHIEPDIETEVHPSFTLGVEIDLGHASLMGAYHLRRGFIVGIGIGF